MPHLSFSELLMIRTSLRTRISDIELGLCWDGMSARDKEQLINRYECLLSKWDDLIDNKKKDSEVFLIEMFI